MAHTVWNLGALASSGRVQPRQFIAGIEPARDIFIGRSREPKKMLVLLDAWLELVGAPSTVGGGGPEALAYSLALGKDPLNDALLLPVGLIHQTGDNTHSMSFGVDQTFKAQGTMWAAKEIAIDVLESGGISVDADLHLEWTVAGVDWWTWFASWDSLEAFPDGSLVDGEKAYA